MYRLLHCQAMVLLAREMATSSVSEIQLGSLVGVVCCNTATLISCTVMSTCNHTCEENGCLERLSHTAWCTWHAILMKRSTLKPYTIISQTEVKRLATQLKVCRSFFAYNLLSEMFFFAEPLSVSLASSPALPSCLGDHGYPERHCHATILVWEDDCLSVSVIQHGAHDRVIHVLLKRSWAAMSCDHATVLSWEMAAWASQ